MPHPADFLDAHRRHWQDAELLFECSRWANADQLYGFSAECGLKAVMVFLGMDTDDTGAPASSQYRRHVHDLWPLFRTFVTQAGGTRFIGMLPAGAPFADWSHADRYSHSMNFDDTTVQPHRLAAQEVRHMIEDWRQDTHS